jgi:NAD(P)-dependent dehydrogenase (short-subunit alcohol dehydrogenase family)
MKVALVTGCSRGLGSGIASRLWEHGFSLAGVARDATKLQDAMALRPVTTGQRAVAIATDLAELANVEALVRRCREEFPRIDLLVNNAAIQGPIGPLGANDWTEWTRTIHVNLLAPVALCKHVVPWMQQAGDGSIVNISGGGATGPRANFSAYGTAKAALVRFSETLADETRGLGVRVNCVAPGAMKTSMLAELLDQGASRAGEAEIAAARRVLVGGGASIERVADLVVFLASDAARSITGKLISAVWDPWESLPEHSHDLASTDIYTLRRITPKDRGMDWGGDR